MVATIVVALLAGDVLDGTNGGVWAATNAVEVRVDDDDAAKRHSSHQIEATATANDNRHRDLQGVAAGAACQRLQAQILGTVQCECKAITMTRFEFQCQSFQTMCGPFDAFCGVPSVLGTVGLNDGAAAAPDDEDQTLGLFQFQGAVCVSNTTIRKKQLLDEPFCLQLPYEDNTSGGSLILNWINALLGIVSSNGLNGKSDSNNDDDAVACRAKIGDQECQSCSKCANAVGGRYTFNCSNIHAEMVASSCQRAQLPRKVRGKRKSIRLFLPTLDDVAR
jgi:hypothetical protein